MAFQTFSVFEKLMVGAADGLFHQIAMAVGTQFRVVAGGYQQLIIGCTVGAMAGLTFSFDNRQVRICFQKLDLSVKMTGVAHRVGFAFEHPVKIGPVGVVTDVAFALGKGLVADVVFLSLAGLRMTAKT